MDNTKANPPLPEPTPQPETKKPIPPQDLSVPQEKKKKLLIVILSLLLIAALSTAGIFAYQYLNLKKQFSGKQSQISPTPTQEPSPIQPTVNWLYYTNEKYDDIKFKYPEGAEIKMSPDPNPTICDTEGCFSIEMSYKDLLLEIKHLTGIGGMTTASDSPYAIVSGNYNEGIGKITELDPINEQTLLLTYFHFSKGGQQFGHFLGGAASFIFTMPSDKQIEYEPIADIIACSVYNQEPNNQGLYTLAYHDRTANSVIGIKNDKSTYVILAADKSIDEKINNFGLNPTSQYLSISTFIDNGPVAYRYFYDLSAKKLLTIDGKEKHSSFGNLETWVSDFEFIDTDSEGHYKYNVKLSTKASITEEEYQGLAK